MKKKQNIILGTLLILIVTITASFSFLTKIDINPRKLKGDISSHTGSVTITCSDETIAVGESTHCILSGTSTGIISGVIGEVSNNENVRINVTKLNSNFITGENGSSINYSGAAINENVNFTIADIEVTGVSVGTGSISFGTNAVLKDDELNDVSLSSVTSNISVVTPDSNNYLSSLSVSDVNISFDREQTIYNVTVPYNVDSVTISASQESPKAFLSGTGTFGVNVGLNAKVVTVKAQNGNEREYTINITREAPVTEVSPKLSSLVIEGADIGTFESNTYSYTATVANNVSSVKIIPTLLDNRATLTGDTGVKSLSVGTNRFIIKVTTENINNSATYNITIVREKSVDSRSSIDTLSSLNVTDTKISKDFKESKNSYTAAVGYSLDSVSISATPTNSKATIKGTGKFNLKVGVNNFNIIVTAENGSINIYKITITRQAEVKNEKENKVVNTTGVKKDSDSLLKELIINNNRIQLDENTFSYKYTVLYKVETLNIDAKAKSSKSKVKISNDKKLEVGKNLITITVEAEDGSETMYVVTVVRKAEDEKLDDDSTLSSLKLGKYDIDFKPTKYTYDLTIKNEDSLDIQYKASNENSNVIITGNYDLENDSVISLIVTAEDGSTSRYIINIKKNPSILLIALIISLSVVLLAGVILAYYFLIIKKRKSKSIPKQENNIEDNGYVIQDGIILPKEEVIKENDELESFPFNDVNE